MSESACVNGFCRSRLYQESHILDTYSDQFASLLCGVRVLSSPLSDRPLSELAADSSSELGHNTYLMALERRSDAALLLDGTVRLYVYIYAINYMCAKMGKRN